MTVYLLLVQENQSELGYIDTTILGVFATGAKAKLEEQRAVLRARDEGLLIEDETDSPHWQVCWRICDYEVE